MKIYLDWIVFVFKIKKKFKNELIQMHGVNIRWDKKEAFLFLKTIIGLGEKSFIWNSRMFYWEMMECFVVEILKLKLKFQKL